MILIPQRLFVLPQVSTLLRDGNRSILHKRLTAAVKQREGYLSEHAISFVLQGEQQITTYEGDTFVLKAGEAALIPRGIYYITDLVPTAGNFESLLFYFDDSLVQDFLQTRNGVAPRPDMGAVDLLTIGRQPELRTYGQSLLQLYGAGLTRQRELTRIKILELLLLLDGLGVCSDFAQVLFQLSLPKQRNIKAFMAANFDKPLKVEDYAYLTGRSLSSFRRDFKSFFATTPQAWLKAQRLEKARQIALAGSISVTELAYEVGYENISYFIKAFKEEFGQSPKQMMLQQGVNI